MGLRDAVVARARKRPWLDHLMRAGSRFGDDNGNHLAAAITYFSVLALFPLLLLAISIAGFILNGHPHQFQQLQNKITTSAPGELKEILRKGVRSAVEHRTGILSFGLVGALYTGMGWIGNLRAAVQLLWGQDKPQENFLVAKARDLLALCGLGLAILVSLGLTTAGTSATSVIMTHTGLDGVPGAAIGTRVAGIVVGIGADLLIFAWMLARLPHQRIAFRSVLGGALFAAVGFEVLKIVGTYYIPKIAQKPQVATFGIVLALMIWVNLVSRFLLFVTAWTATARGSLAVAAEQSPEPRAVESPVGAKVEPPMPTPPRGQAAPNGAVLAVGVFGAGAAAGAAVVAAVRRRIPRGRRTWRSAGPDRDRPDREGPDRTARISGRDGAASTGRRRASQARGPRRHR